MSNEAGGEDLIPHRWDLTEVEAVALQKRLAGLVKRENDPGFSLDTLRTIAGIDVSLAGEGKAAVVVLSWPDLETVEQVTATAKIVFPYVPGLLSFREAPLVLAALEKLSVKPDVLMVDGQGYAHPRRFGIACHLGVLTDTPALGVAKKPLVGRFEGPGEEAGSEAPILHRGEVVGTALRAKVRTNPLIISAGHRLDLTTAVTLVKQTLRGYRLPEPTRRAHNAADSAVPIGR